MTAITLACGSPGRGGEQRLQGSAERPFGPRQRFADSPQHPR
jgi:hypothetical protein